MKPIITVFSLFVIVDCVYGYEVSIVLDPPTGPYRIDYAIGCSCFVNPLPPPPVSYQLVTPQFNGYYTSNRQNTSFTPLDAYDEHFKWIYCIVYSNSKLVAKKSRMIEIHGYIYPLGRPVRTFTTGETLSLQINISTNYDRARYIQNLTWYHNGSEVCSCHTRNNGTEFVLPNMNSSDAGTYQVKVTSLAFGRPECDSMLLPHLETLAFIAPVTFVLTQGVPLYNPVDIAPIQRHYIVTNVNTSVMFSNEYHFHRNITQRLSSSHQQQSWFHNGEYIAVNNNLKYTSTLSVQLNSVTKATFEVINASTEDVGDYLGIISLTSYDILSWCPDIRTNFIPFFSDFLRSNQKFPITITYYSIQVYQPPSVVLSFSQKTAFAGMVVDMSCVAVGGNPNIHNLTLLKNNNILKTTVESNSLVHHIRNSYGVYTCMVNSLHSTGSKLFLLQEKANLTILLATGATSCQEILPLNENGLLLVRISTEINETVQNLCGCLAVVEVTSLSCGLDVLIVNGMITYSDGNGEVTATTVVDMLQEWILNTNDPFISIEIDGNVLELRLSRYCVVRTTSLSDSSSASSRINGAIGGSFTGGVITGVFTTFFVICITIYVLNVKAKMQMAHVQPSSVSVSNKEDVEMGSNQAYESVTRRYAAGTSRLHQRSTTELDEPVYELPPST